MNNELTMEELQLLIQMLLEQNVSGKMAEVIPVIKTVDSTLTKLNEMLKKLTDVYVSE